MKKMLKQVLPMNLQFFAEKDDDNDDVTKGGTEESGDGGTGDDNGDKDTGGQKGKPERTFTQAEVDAIATKEKKEGRKALLKQLGFKNEAEAQAAMKLYGALVDSQKSEEEKKDEKLKGLEDSRTDAEKRAEAAEEKLACVMVGVNKDSLDDVLAIAKLKVTDEKSLDKVLAEMKKDARYVSFFGEESKDGGTGRGPGHTSRSDGTKKGEFGKSLAQPKGNGKKEKKSFFD